MMTDFNTVHDRRKTDSIKWNRYPEDVLPLWVADLDFPSPPAVIHDLQDRVAHGIFGYSVEQAHARQTVSNWLEIRHNWQVTPDEIILIPGVVQGFNIAARAFTRPGDSLIIQTPAYHPFFRVAPHAGLKQIVHKLAVRPDGYYFLNEDHFENCLQPDTRLLMLCNPHNPTGRVFTRDELLSLAEICLKNHVLICSDEIHSDIIYPPHKHIPIASLSKEIASRTVTLISPSKTFNLAGLKAAAVVIPNKSLRARYQNHLQACTGSVNLLGQTALISAYTTGDKWLSELINHLSKNRLLLANFVQDELPGVKLLAPEGTYLGWLDFQETGLDDPADYLLREAKVALNQGEWFGSDFQKFGRINFGCPTKLLLTALDRIKKGLT